MSATGRKAAIEAKSDSDTADPMVYFDEDKQARCVTGPAGRLQAGRYRLVSK
jgi:hypothetical protein